MKRYNRRRFLKISVATTAASMLSGVLGARANVPTTWNGVVLGADASIKIYNGAGDASLAIQAALQEIREQERTLSIYDPNSDLSLLNKTGLIETNSGKSASLRFLIAQSKTIHHLTGELFDPSIQPLFEAYARADGNPSRAQLQQAMGLIGLGKVDIFDRTKICFKQKGMALTFNGIAQGFITDKVREILNGFGYKHALINIGEYSIGEKNACIGIADAAGEIFDVANLYDEAIATSSPSGYRFADGTSHILHPSGSKYLTQWDTVSVIAQNAMHADGYSTALAMAPDSQLARRLVKGGVIKKVILKKTDGQILHIE